MQLDCFVEKFTQNVSAVSVYARKEVVTNSLQIICVYCFISEHSRLMAVSFPNKCCFWTTALISYF